MTSHARSNIALAFTCASIATITLAPPTAAAPPAVQTVVINSAGNPVPVTGAVDVYSPPVTHMGANVLDHVTLVTGGANFTTCPANQLAAFRQLPDGSVPLVEFVVPEGRMFVFTDVGIGFQENLGKDWVAGGDIVTAQVRMGLPGPSGLDTIWQSSIQIDAILEASEIAWIRESLASGAVVGPGRRLCIKAGFGINANAGEVDLLNLSKMYGYFVDVD